jgi:hypothetical protein
MTMTMTLAMAGKQKNMNFGFWSEKGTRAVDVVLGRLCTCTMGVLYGHTGTIHHQTTKMRAYLPG